MLYANIQAFIAARCREHPQCSQWLADWTPEHETQINVDPTDLEPCESYWLTPDGDKVANIRIPHGAMTQNPTFFDRQQFGPVHNYWSHIGTTGWNWKRQQSMWVGFDFDALNHKSGLTPVALAEVKQRAACLPYVIPRTSKSGEGVHLIVPLNPWIPTRTHTEHSALAKAVLARMGQDCGYDFRATADVAGGNLWHWAKGLQHAGLQRIEYGGLATASDATPNGS